eukprot:TRINITY_DN2150_c0_g1_i1.p1 TRINITY_DN2150_c0_g1~~TRINITY_DN2150_c0_g1_i1.p1  ORF type:complete len:1182 (-),score=440.97 TRINITY_DN2150_c0_g1_i1:176-3721(-)
MKRNLFIFSVFFTVFSVFINPSFSTCYYTYDSKDSNRNQGLELISSTCKDNSLNITFNGQFNDNGININWRKEFSWRELYLSSTSNTTFRGILNPLSSNASLSYLVLSNFKFFDSFGDLFSFNSSNVNISSVYVFGSSSSLLSKDKGSIYKSNGAMTRFEMDNCWINGSRGISILSSSFLVGRIDFDHILSLNNSVTLLSSLTNTLYLSVSNSIFKNNGNILLPFASSSQSIESQRKIEIIGTNFENGTDEQLSFSNSFSVSLMNCRFFNYSYSNLISLKGNLYNFEMNGIAFQNVSGKDSIVSFQGNASQVFLSRIEASNLNANSLFHFFPLTNYQVILFYQLEINQFNGNSIIFFDKASSSGFLLEDSAFYSNSASGNFVHIEVKSKIEDGVQYVFFPSFLQLDFHQNSIGGNLISMEGSFIGPILFENSTFESNLANNLIQVDAEYFSFGLYNSSFVKNQLRESIHSLNGAVTGTGYQSTILIQSCDFYNNEALNGEIFSLIPLESRLNILDSSFSFNRISSILYTINRNNIQITNSSFGQNEGLLLDISQINDVAIFITNCILGENSMMSLSGGNFSIQSSSFGKDSSLSLGNTTIVYISDSLFPFPFSVDSLSKSEISTMVLTRNSFKDSPLIKSKVNSIYFYDNRIPFSFNELFNSFNRLEETLVLYLADNRMNGNLSFLNRMKSSTAIELSGNLLNGNLPNIESSFSSLWYLSVSNNKLEGTIPSSFGLLKNLAYLDLSFNRLNGTIPNELGSLTSLIQLDLSDNKLQGVVPNVVANLHLNELDLSNNNLTGMNKIWATHCNLEGNQLMCPLNDQVFSRCGKLTCKFSPYYFCRLSDDCTILDSFSMITDYIIEGTDSNEKETNFISLLKYLEGGMITNYTSPQDYCDPMLSLSLNLSFIPSIDKIFSLCGVKYSTEKLLQVSGLSISNLIARLEVNPQNSSSLLHSIGAIIWNTFPPNETFYSSSGSSVSFAAVKSGPTKRQLVNPLKTLSIPSSYTGNFIDLTFSSDSEFNYLVGFRINWLGGRTKGVSSQSEIIGIVTAVSSLDNQEELSGTIIQPINGINLEIYNYTCLHWSEEETIWISDGSALIVNSNRSISCEVESFGYYSISRTRFRSSITSKNPSADNTIVYVTEGSNALMILGAILLAFGFIFICVALFGFVAISYSRKYKEEK